MNTCNRRAYRGRFAPSPTGPLHFGSLVAAVGSFLDARAHAGEWLVRIEDLDPPREVPGSAQSILDTLQAFGMVADGGIVYQSRRAAHYERALQQLETRDVCYPCACSRQEIRQIAASGSHPGIYPGTCRNGLPTGREPRVTRLRVPDLEIGFHDRLQGDIRQWLPTACGDFILRRADGLFAYQLAVVVDDALQGITHVVRGADLLDSTPRQILLQQWLGYPVPEYLHLPVAANERGEKLSKQTRAAPVDAKRAVPTLCEVMTFLGHVPPRRLHEATIDAFWQWAIACWQPARLPAQRSIKRIDTPFAMSVQ
jgi:glutamyl-Q tRNA(Asp) synthetase